MCTDVSDHFLIVHIEFEMKLCDIDTAVNHRGLSYETENDHMDRFRLLLGSLLIMWVTCKLHFFVSSHNVEVFLW